ncbi:protein THEMIS2 [Chanos chanos]|uniref:Protein THEMIS2 n=1 Tax=Chanos chanos TaxID=29144 RepID=A0A6J2W517_CHACN|nr:protein THEMIS2 [Chanos chanos]
MADTDIALSMRDYIRSLDHNSLPRILQVCSGVYFQGSIYEISGCEVCLSTGDFVKIIGLELLSVSCEDISTNTTFELPLNHSGLFKLIPDDVPYNTIEEIVGLTPVGVDSFGSFSFTSINDLTFDNLTWAAGRPITLLSVEETETGERQARCQLTGQHGAPAEVRIPLLHHGEFYECESEYGYTLQEILSSPRLSARRFRKKLSTKCGGPLVFAPVYQIQAIMHMRKNIVKFPSSLEVDVTDVTEESQHLTFVTPLTLAEVVAQPADAFPTMAEILEGPEAKCFFSCSWFSQLQKGCRLVLHKAGESTFVLVTTLKGRKAQQYFLVSKNYGGRLRRRPREFSSAYELYLAFMRHPGLRVNVTQHCEAIDEEGIPALSVGEQLEVMHLKKMELSGDSKKEGQTVEVLVCKRVTEDDDDDDDDDDNDDVEEAQEEESEEVCLPLFMGAHFVEKLSDKKKYRMTDLIQSHSLPLDVKVVTRDGDIEKDALVALPALKLEETVAEPMVLASLPDKPGQCFEMPVKWLQMSVSLTSDPLPWQGSKPPKLQLQAVTEVTDHFYFEFHKLSCTNDAPPPRPPKRSTSVQKPQKQSKAESLSVSTNQLKGLTLDEKPKRPKKNPAPPPLPPYNDFTEKPPPLLPRKHHSASDSTAKSNTYVQTPRRQEKKGSHTEIQSSDSEHDYESLDESVKNAHENIMFY